LPACKLQQPSSCARGGALNSVIWASLQSCALAGRLRQCSLETVVTAHLLSVPVATTVLVGQTAFTNNKKEKYLHRACDLDHVWRGCSDSLVQTCLDRTLAGLRQAATSNPGVDVWPQNTPTMHGGPVKLKS